MEFGKFSFPPSSNWFYPHLLDVSVDCVIAYGTKSKEFCNRGHGLSAARKVLCIVVLESVKKNGKQFMDYVRHGKMQGQ